MDDASLRRSTIAHLQVAHAAERAQLGELRTLRDEVGIPAVAALLDQHLMETIAHGDRLEERLEELESGSSIRLLVQSTVGSVPKLVVDRLRPQDGCACLRDAIAAEAAEIATYGLLEIEATRAGDESTAVLAQEIRVEEVAARDELGTFWNQAVDVAIAAGAAASGATVTKVARALLVDHLRDVHALERNAAIMLSTVLGTVRDDVARERVEDHRAATVRHGDMVLERLRELGSGPSRRKQAQGLAFAAVKGPFNLVRTERAAKDLRDMYVVEHLESVAYAQLAVLAQRAGDERTQALAGSHALEAATMSDWLERETARFALESLAGGR
ncbi:MAG: hypothetical protein JWM98_29 [Thermoleophilia bacterium]|nr:hypothetical protein [Thermoleophilia bacterium]